MRIIFLVVATMSGATAFAQGFPSDPLVYRGVVAVGTVAPNTPMRVTLWRSATGTATPAEQLCGNNVVSRPVSPDASGRFEVGLEPECVEAVRGNADIWVQLEINTVPVLPRARIKAVPFALKAQVAGRTVYSSDAGAVSEGLFCGQSAAPTNGLITSGQLVGYRAARALCQAGCVSPTAHMCSVAEILRSHELGLALPVDGWVKAGAYSIAVPNLRHDCDAFKVGSATGPAGSYFGFGWDNAQEGVGTAPCNAQYRINCCD